MGGRAASRGRAGRIGSVRALGRLRAAARGPARRPERRNLLGRPPIARRPADLGRAPDRRRLQLARPASRKRAPLRFTVGDDRRAAGDDLARRLRKLQRRRAGRAERGSGVARGSRRGAAEVRLRNSRRLGRHSRGGRRSGRTALSHRRRAVERRDRQLGAFALRSGRRVLDPAARGADSLAGARRLFHYDQRCQRAGGQRHQLLRPALRARRDGPLRRRLPRQRCGRCDRRRGRALLDDAADRRPERTRRRDRRRVFHARAGCDAREVAFSR